MSKLTMTINSRPGTDVEPEDILSSSLQTLYSFVAITHSSAGSVYDHASFFDGKSISISLQTPDTHAANWSLHASSIWVAAVYIADHIDNLRLDSLSTSSGLDRLEILELGAGAGLPGILIAKCLQTMEDAYPRTQPWRVTLSDYPDDNITRTLEENVKSNGLEGKCRVIPYSWGTDSFSLLSNSPESSSNEGYDLIIAADTLWNGELHDLLLQTLTRALRRTCTARVHLVAGLHTGRYTLQGFLSRIRASDLEILSIEEREVNGESVRTWDAAREDDEDERERRRWIVWIIVKWKEVHSGHRGDSS